MAQSRIPFGVVTKHGKFAGNNVLDHYALKTSPESRAITPDLFEKSYAKDGLVQPLYNPETLARALEINTYHYRCCRAKARDTAGLGWVLSPVVENPSEAEHELIKDFFDNQMSEPPSTIFNRAMLDFESIGQGALELVREGYEPDGLPITIEHIPVHTLRVHKSGNKFCQLRGKHKRWFKKPGYEFDIDYRTGEEYPLGELNADYRATEIIWFANYTPRSDFYGLPDVIPALGAIHGDLSRRNYNISFFDNHGVPAYAVFITGNFDNEELTDEQGNPLGRTQLEEDIEKHFSEMAKNPHSTLVLSIPTREREGEVKVDFQALSVETKDASFRLFRKDNRDEVISAHGVPPYRAAIAEEGSLGGSFAKEATEIYKRSIVEPRQETLEALVNKFIITEGFEAQDWTFQFKEIDTSDEKHDLEVLNGLFDRGAVTPNQVIQHFKDRFGLEQVDHPAMDAHYIGGLPIDREVDEAQEALLSLQNRLLTVAEKESAKDPGILQAVKGIFTGGRKSWKHSK